MDEYCLLEILSSAFWSLKSLSRYLHLHISSSFSEDENFITLEMSIS